MKQSNHSIASKDIPRFDRRTFNVEDNFSCIGYGSIGGKASGLAFIDRFLKENFPDNIHENIRIKVPNLTVIATSVFDVFMKTNKLYDIAYSDEPDDRIAHAFQQGEIPVDIIGDLRTLVNKITTPLAVRSSSMLEDAMYEPFAGVYGTKMIPNNQPDADTRFKRLTEAIKFVYASTFFRDAKNYIRRTKKDIKEEKMAVIIQEVVGIKHNERYYPNISGVGRSYNFYPTGHAKPENGVVDLALGLGKTIVDGGRCWTYSPAYPKASPPSTIAELLKQTQTEFWAVNMSRPAAFDPIRETEYLVKADLKASDYDDTLKFTASTYRPQDDRVVMGVGAEGPRILNFAPILSQNDIPLNPLVTKMLKISEDAIECEVEIEFALTIDTLRNNETMFGFLQVRPMVVSSETIDISEEEFQSSENLAATKLVMGNGSADDLFDIVYIKPEGFEAKYTRQIAVELEEVNRQLQSEGKEYILIGFGRWGSSDPWLGVPVNWGEISAARVIVEATLPDMNVELSQGSHFFHNISSFGIFYLCMPHTGKHLIDWNWLNGQEPVADKQFIRWVRTKQPLTVKVDGKNRLGVIRR